MQAKAAHATDTRLSAVVAVKNGERYLARALRSIRAQTLRPFEIVLVDGASTDRTIEIARDFTDVRVVQQTGPGIADAYNCGVAATASEYVAFLSHDDEWTPDKLEVQMEYMDQHPELQYTRTLACSRLEEGHAPPPGFRVALLHQEHAGAMETLVARRAAFAAVGPFDSRFESGEDVDWFARASDLGIASATVPRVLLTKYVHASNLSLTTASNDHSLLTALRDSIRRKPKL